jgi:hypothetical protein
MIVDMVDHFSSESLTFLFLLKAERLPDIISSPLSILLPCGVFPGKMGTAQSRLKDFCSIA